MDNNILVKVLESLQKIEDSLFRTKTFFTVDELSEFAGISKSTIYKLTSAKEIPHYKKAKHLVFDRLEIESWIKSNRVLTHDEINRKAEGLVRGINPSKTDYDE